MADAHTARIALLQLTAFSIEDAEQSLAHTLQRIDDAAREKPDVIALPEVTYPAYFMGTDDLSRRNVLSPAEAMARFAEKARKHGMYIAVGMALDAKSGGYSNGAALFGRDGELIGRYEKSFLWHFDNRWFKPGNAYPVFELDFGRVGMLVCADGRLPEIARSLALNGAQIILDLTAWVSGARHAADLTTSQRRYLMQTRAAENGVWVACADKCGIEAESSVYAGRSCVINRRGEYVASLGPDEDAVLVYDVPIEDAGTQVERRPELYQTLAQPTQSLPVLRTLDEAFIPSDGEHRIAAVQMTMPPTGAEFLAVARRHVERLALQDAELVLFPATPGRLRSAYPHDPVLSGMTALASETGICTAFTASEPDADGWRTMYLVGPRGVIAKHRQTHKGRGPRFATMPIGDEVCPVVHTPVGRVGLLAGAEGFVPEVARSLMLRGAEILLWSTDDPPSPMEMFVRTRADENRVFVASAAAPSANGASMIADPTGAVIAIALEGEQLAVAADVNRAMSHLKQRAPGTDVVRNRLPASYGAIVAQAVAPAAVRS
ncbi:MAG: carbon-nitrogen hydrolase family protein [Chloroflexota bacterium]|nr:carbon-nitrogen hydrolase family protein [Chloroflexota bacterium]